jgi:hypothetical protein
VIHFCEDPSIALCGETDGTSNAFAHVNCPVCRCKIRQTKLAPVGLHDPEQWSRIFDRSRLTGVAIKFRGKIYALPEPNRHHHIIRDIMRANPDVNTVVDDEQGFLDEGGHFLTRACTSDHKCTTAQSTPARTNWRTDKRRSLVTKGFQCPPV